MTSEFPLFEANLPQKCKTLNLAQYKAGLRADVYERYKALKARGIGEETARNTAAAQSAVAPGAKHGSGRFRLELDALLDRSRKMPAFLGEHMHWRLPT